MDSAQTQFHSVKPRRPQIYSYNPLEDSNFNDATGKLLSKNSSSTIFTAEYNFVGNGVKNVFAYQNDNDYAYVKTDLTAKKVSLYTVTNGVEKEVASGSIVRAYDATDLLQTVRVAYRDGKADVYFDDLLKIENADVSLKAGKIGYLYTGEATFGYTAVSSTAKGLSDAIEPKQSYINIGAQTYLPQGVYECHGSSFTGRSGYLETDATEYGGKRVGLGKMRLANANDKAVYLVDFKESRTGSGKGYYALQMTLNKNMSGKRFGVRVDGSRIYVVTIPEISPTSGDSLVKTFVTELPVEKGVRQISFIGLGDEIEFHSFSFTESTSDTFTYEESLSIAPEKGMQQLSLWRFEGAEGDEVPSLVSREGTRSLVYFGEKGLINYSVECDFRINTDGVYTAGFIVHGQRYSNSAYVTEDYKHMQGYYVALNKRMAKIEKLNYTHTDSNAAAERIELDIGSWNHIRIDVAGNTINVTVTNSAGNAKNLTFTDDIAFSGGRFGFYSAGASTSYKNLKITG